CQQSAGSAVLDQVLAMLQTVRGFTEQGTVHSECRRALKAWCAPLEGTRASLQVWRAREKVWCASLEGTRASLQVWRAREKVWCASREETRASLQVSQAKQKVWRASPHATRTPRKVARLTLPARSSLHFASL